MHAIAALVTLVGVLATAGPASASETVSPHILEQFVDQQFVPPLRSYDQHLTIGDARCPRGLDRRAAQKVYCTITVDGFRSPSALSRMTPRNLPWCSRHFSIFKESRASKKRSCSNNTT
jgi:hypothetical protein